MNILIIGGAYQGKRRFAESFFGLASNAFLDGAQMPLDGPIHKIAIDQTHLLVRRMLAAGLSVKDLLSRLDGHIVLCDELGCGVVPIDPDIERWREATGRLCCDLAERADAVYWVRAGIAQCIKERKL